MVPSRFKLSPGPRPGPKKQHNFPKGPSARPHPGANLGPSAWNSGHGPWELTVRLPGRGPALSTPLPPRVSQLPLHTSAGLKPKLREPRGRHRRNLCKAVSQPAPSSVPGFAFSSVFFLYCCQRLRGCTCSTAEPMLPGGWHPPPSPPPFPTHTLGTVQGTARRAGLGQAPSFGFEASMRC